MVDTNFLNKFIFSTTLKKYMRRNFLQRERDEVFQNIKNLDDAESLLEYPSITIEHFQGQNYVDEYDLITMEKSIGFYQIALLKILLFYFVWDVKYSRDYIINLIKRIPIYEREIEQLRGLYCESFK